MKKNTVICLLLVSILLLQGVNHTAQAEETSSGDDWEFALAPFYLWAVSLDGDVVVGPQGSNVSLDFGDIFDNLEAVFIIHFETIYKKNYGFLFDVNFINLGVSSSTPKSEINVDLEATVAEFLPYYRWLNGDHNLDFMAGALYSRVAQDVSFSSSPFAIDVTEDWVDPIMGIRWNWGFSDKWRLVAKGVVGGFGVSSDLVWEGSGMVTYQPWKNAEFLLGYRAVGIDYETGAGPTRFEYDVTMAGPVFGINFKW
ncbi:MAG: hypothetical protein ACI8PB_005493 [Desulforhopalus sp.]|jgi:hypothetical protein